MQRLYCSIVIPFLLLASTCQGHCIGGGCDVYWNSVLDVGFETLSLIQTHAEERKPNEEFNLNAKKFKKKSKRQNRAKQQAKTGEDRGFLIDADFEQWLEDRGWTGCDVEEIDSSADFDFKGKPQIKRTTLPTSSATLQDFWRTAGDSIIARGSNNNQALVIHRLNTTGTMEYLQSATDGQKDGKMQQLHPEIGLVGLTGSQSFNWQDAAPEYVEWIEQGKQEGVQHDTDIYAPSRNGFNFHAHQGFVFRPVRGKKLFILGASIGSWHPDDTPPGLEENTGDDQFFFDMTALPSIVVLQKYESWFRQAKGLQFCLLKEGDHLMVPHFWYHFTVSVGDSLSVSAFMEQDYPVVVKEECPVEDATSVNKYTWSRGSYLHCHPSTDTTDPKDFCTHLLPQPEEGSKRTANVCDISYRFMSEWCSAQSRGESEEGADESLLSMIEPFRQAAREGGTENAHAFRLLLTVWQKLAETVGHDSLKADLQSIDSDVSQVDSPILGKLNVDQDKTNNDILKICPELKRLLYGISSVTPELLFSLPGAHP